MSKNNNYAAPSFPNLLGLLFIGLKLTGCIDWPWWAVLAPFWVPLAFVLVCLIILGACEYLEG